MPLRPEAIRRLAFVRLLLSRATEESHLNAPFSYDSVGRFHDAAEMFLTLAVQEHHLDIPKDFIKYWDVLQASLGRPLLYRAQAERFNKVRVAWKHYGAEPSSAEIEAARTTVTGLLQDECEPLFGVSLHEASLSAFVTPESARNLLDSAEDQWRQGDEAEAFADLADAFDHLLSDYKRRKMIGHNRSIYDFSRDFTFLSGFFRGLPFGKERDFNDGVIESLKRLNDAVTLIGLGLDFRRYGKFLFLTPNMQRNAAGTRITHEAVRSNSRTTEDFEFCRDFIVSSAIHLAEFDYDLDATKMAGNSWTRRVGRKRDLEQEEGDPPTPSHN